MAFEDVQIFRNALSLKFSENTIHEALSLCIDQFFKKMMEDVFDGRELRTLLSTAPVLRV